MVNDVDIMLSDLGSPIEGVMIRDFVSKTEQGRSACTGGGVLISESEELEYEE